MVFKGKGMACKRSGNYSIRRPLSLFDLSLPQLNGAFSHLTKHKLNIYTVFMTIIYETLKGVE